MMKLTDYNLGEVWLNPDLIVSISQQIRDCRVEMSNGTIFMVDERDTNILEQIELIKQDYEQWANQ